MDDRDIVEIANRLNGGQNLLNKLTAFVHIHQAEQITILGEDLRLTTGQLNGLKSKALEVAQKISTGADAVTAIVPGTVNVGVLQKLQTVPQNIPMYLQAVIESGGRIEGGPDERGVIEKAEIVSLAQLYQREVSEQTDGSFRKPYGDEEAAMLGNHLATLGAAVKWLAASEAAKLG